MPLHGTSKGPSLVAEQLAFDQPGGQGAAIERDKGLPLTPTQIVDPLSEYALANTGLTHHQHRHIGLGHLCDFL